MKSLPAAVSLFCIVAGCRGDARLPQTNGPPQRIVSQLVLADEILWELGPEVRSRVVAVSRMADDQRYSGVIGKWPASVPRVPGSSEAMVMLRPDLVFIGSFTSEDVRALLRRAGIRTLVVDALSSFDEFRSNVMTIANVVGAPQGGADLIARFERRLARLRREPVTPPVTAISWSEGIVAGANTTFADTTTTLGLRNPAADHGLRGHRRVTLEQLVLWDPELIVIACGLGQCGNTSASFAKRLGITNTRAGRHDGVVAIPERIMLSTGLGMLDFVETLGGAALRIREARLP